MAAHGTFEVNGWKLGYWAAVRRATEEQQPVNVYDCEVVVYEKSGEPMRSTFEVEHNYEDGIVVLAAKVLAQHTENAQSARRGHLDD